MVDLHSPTMDQLFRAIMSLDSLDECYAFFDDICNCIKVMIDPNVIPAIAAAAMYSDASPMCSAIFDKTSPIISFKAASMNCDAATAPKRI